MTLWQVIDSRFMQAVVAGGFLALGWIVTGAQNRRADVRRREERLRDYHRALFAEIAAHLGNLGTAEELRAYRDHMLSRMMDEGHVPLIPTERNATVYAAMMEDLSILPRVTIDPIVIYYAGLEARDALVSDMRGERFRALEPESRAEMYQDYIDMKLQTLKDGAYALDMIAAFAEGGKVAAERRRAALSTRDGDPSGR